MALAFSKCSCKEKKLYLKAQLYYTVVGIIIIERGFPEKTQCFVLACDDNYTCEYHKNAPVMTISLFK